MDKYQVQAQQCKNEKDCNSDFVSGTWSPVYDQSFAVELENGMRFLANFKYTIKDEIAKSSGKPSQLMQTYETLKTGDYGKFDSHCDQTMVGFVQ